MMTFIKRYAGHLFFIIWYGILNLILLLHEGSFLYVMLVWNVILALTPYLLADLTDTLYRQNNRFWFIAIFMWWIFLPNSYYMVTDFIHLSNDHFFVFNSAGYFVGYTTDLMLWLKMAVIGIGMFYATALGIRSFYKIYHTIIESGALAWRVLFAVSVFVSNGVAIYIGRFLRFNSWNIFQISQLYQYWLTYGHGLRFTVSFIAVMTLYIGSVTLVYPLLSTSFNE